MRIHWHCGAWLVGLLAGGCFTDSGGAPCPEGSEGCACVELQCEAGLMCSGGVCVALATGTGTDASGTAAGTSEPATSTTTAGADDTTGSSSSTTAPATSGSTDSTGVDLCGNGVLDPEEMCDGTNACGDDCTLDNYPCNPFNNVGCDRGQKCSFLDPTTILCLAFGPDVGDFGANECFHGAAPHDEDCAIGLACIPFQITNTCDGGGCCEEYCDLGDPTFECSTPGNTCQPAYGSPPFEPGLEWVGFCGN